MTQGFVGKFRRRPESERFFRLAKTAKQAMLVLSSIQPDEARRKKSRSKPDRIVRQSPDHVSGNPEAAVNRSRNRLNNRSRN